MRFKKFITEEELDLPSKCKIIKSHCSQFLKEAGEYPAYRGQKNHSFENNTFPMRKTKDTRFYAVNIFNLYMEEKFKIKHARNEHAVFSNGDYSEVDLYGDLFFFFPENDYQYFWSPMIRDFMERERAIWNNISAEVIKRFPDEGREALTILRDVLDNRDVNPTIKDMVTTLSPELKLNSGKNAYAMLRKSINYVYDDLDYKMNYIKSALESRTEIIFRTKKYYLISPGEIKKHFELETANDVKLSSLPPSQRTEQYNKTKDEYEKLYDNLLELMK